MRVIVVVGLAALLAGCGPDKNEEFRNSVAEAGVISAEAELGLIRAREPANHAKLCAARKRLAVAYMTAGRAEDRKSAEAKAAKECARVE